MLSLLSDAAEERPLPRCCSGPPSGSSRWTSGWPGRLTSRLAAAQFAGRFAVDGNVVEVAHAALAAPPASQRPRASDLLTDALATLIARGYEPGAPMVKRALSAFRSGDMSDGEAPWIWLLCRTAVDVWDYDGWERLRADGGARPTLGRSDRPSARSHLADGGTPACRRAGRRQFVTRGSQRDQRRDRDTSRSVQRLAAFAWRGSEAEVAGLIEATLREVALRGEGQGVAVAQSAGAILYNGLGRSQEALGAARIASECRGELVFRNWGLAELVEAAVRCGDGAAATDALESLSQTTRPSDTDWALGVEARCRAAQPRRNRRASLPRGNRTVGSQPRSRAAPSGSCRPLASVSANAS